MTQNIYDDAGFFAGYATLDRSVKGLDGAPEWPALRALLPELTGARVLDLGCGYGWFCRYARQSGAQQVTGVDVSTRMLEKAQQMTDDDGIVYQLADLTSLHLTPNSIDLAYSSLALHYLEDVDALFATLYQALTPGGRLIFSAEHPIYTSPRTPGWLRDNEGHLNWPVSQYQQEGERVTQWFADNVRKQHRKLSSWVNAVIASGFVLEHLDEWGPSPEQIAAHPALAEECERPMMFLLAACKPA